MFWGKQNILLFVAIGLLLLGATAVFFYIGESKERSIFIERKPDTFSASGDNKEEVFLYNPNNLSGIRCKNFDRRPFAVMVAEDIEARPLSGIGFADLVIEMPVVTGSITRMMTVFICEDPEEIGSVRSARHDFIPVALGYDAIFAHWGGSVLALEELRAGNIDNLDALPNYFKSFYRKSGEQAPHDGFTSLDRMINAAEKMGYRLTSKFEGYKFVENSKFSPSEAQTLEIGYKYPYNIRYEYNPDINYYLRWRGGLEEIDKLTGEQVMAKNIVVMRAKSRQIGGGYNDVDILGSGEAVIYANGEEMRGEWRKDRAEDALRFFDNGGEEIGFAPGGIWINVVEPSTVVNYE